MAVPVYNVIGFLCADDTEGVDGSVGGGEVGVLTWSTGEASCWGLTAGQELTHTGKKRGGVTKHYLSCASTETQISREKFLY